MPVVSDSQYNYNSVTKLYKMLQLKTTVSEHFETTVFHIGPFN